MKAQSPSHRTAGELSGLFIVIAVFLIPKGFCHLFSSIAALSLIPHFLLQVYFQESLQQVGGRVRQYVGLSPYKAHLA